MFQGKKKKHVFENESQRLWSRKESMWVGKRTYVGNDIFVGEKETVRERRIQQENGRGSRQLCGGGRKLMNSWACICSCIYLFILTKREVFWEADRSFISWIPSHFFF